MVKRKIDEHAPFISAPGKAHSYFAGKVTVHKCADLKEVQKKCSLSARKYKPIIEFLKSQQPDKNRALFNIHENLLENLKQTLEERILTLPEPALAKMLNVTLYFLMFDELKAIPLEIMRRLKGSIPVRLCQTLAGDLKHRLQVRALYFYFAHLKAYVSFCRPLSQELPLSIKRQVWTQSPKIFLESIRDLCAVVHSLVVAQKDVKYSHLNFGNRREFLMFLTLITLCTGHLSLLFEEFPRVSVLPSNFFPFFRTTAVFSPLRAGRDMVSCYASFTSAQPRVLIGCIQLNRVHLPNIIC